MTSTRNLNESRLVQAMSAALGRTLREAGFPEFAEKFSALAESREGVPTASFETTARRAFYAVGNAHPSVADRLHEAPPAIADWRRAKALALDDRHNAARDALLCARWRPLNTLSRETIESLAGPDGRAWFEVRCRIDDVDRIWALWFDTDDQLATDTINQVNWRLPGWVLSQYSARPLRLAPAAWSEGA